MAISTLLIRALLLFLMCLPTACKQKLSSQLPGTAIAGAPAAPWLAELIQHLQQAAPTNPPAKIYRYTYHQQEVYYLAARCCDVPGKVYDALGNVLCEPSGGITGKGDGRCPDFVAQRENETLIWEDKRVY